MSQIATAKILIVSYHFPPASPSDPTRREGRSDRLDGACHGVHSARSSRLPSQAGKIVIRHPALNGVGAEQLVRVRAIKTYR
jgi:hypothetical protein